MPEVEIRIANRLDELEKVVRAVDAFAAAHDIPAGVLNRLNLVLDEVLNNIVSYGYPDGAPGEIRLRLDRDPAAVRAEIEDDGIPFAWPPPGPLDRSVPARERAVGGAGLRFIHGLMDAVAYERIANRNRLRLTKRIPPGPLAES
jgi:anti-sigma regulatory factor (Ser/Thr protein kinase)